MFTEGATIKQLDNFWGTDAQQDAAASNAADKELVQFCKEDLTRTINKYADMLGVDAATRACAEDYIADMLGDVFGKILTGEV